MSTSGPHDHSLGEQLLTLDVETMTDSQKAVETRSAYFCVSAMRLLHRVFSDR